MSYRGEQQVQKGQAAVLLCQDQAAPIRALYGQPDDVRQVKQLAYIHACVLPQDVKENRKIIPVFYNIGKNQIEQGQRQFQRPAPALGQAF